MASWLKRLILLIGLAGSVVVSSLAAAEEIHVVASTSWTGAMAEAAGAAKVTVLAPLDMKHPTEYDFKPSDIQTALTADWIVWAGYEPFINRLVEAANIPESKLIQVQTGNSPENLNLQIPQLAEKLGTSAKASQWLAKFNEFTAKLKEAAKQQGASETRVAVHFHQQGLIKWLGYDVVGIFGPGEITPGDIVKILGEGPTMIIDNWHSNQGEPFQGPGREYVALLNFPGYAGTRTLMDVLRYNAGQLGLEW